MCICICIFVFVCMRFQEGVLMCIGICVYEVSGGCFDVYWYLCVCRFRRIERFDVYLHLQVCSRVF